MFWHAILRRLYPVEANLLSEEGVYSHLPEDISERHALLLEPMLATGGSALTAVQVLTEAGAMEENIIFIDILASPQGLKRVTTVHPIAHRHVVN
jgi:uracil phosphoribosyltransferase